VCFRAIQITLFLLGYTVTDDLPVFSELKWRVKANN
jgi:hypothetical protein